MRIRLSIAHARVTQCFNILDAIINVSSDDIDSNDPFLLWLVVPLGLISLPPSTTFYLLGENIPSLQSSFRSAD